MAITHLPISVQRLVSLGEAPYNLPSSSFRYNSLAIESDQFVCVKDVAPDGSNQVVIVDLHKDNAITKRPTKRAEAALMHVKDNIIVLKGKNDNGTGHFIQIFNLDTKSRLLEHNFASDVVFWTWVNPQTLGVVTATDVWHCSLEEGKVPEKIFDRGGQLADPGVQIINYAVDGSVLWCLLAGISTVDRKVINGHLQLFSIERGQQQFLEGHAGCFSSIIIDDARPPIEVFSFVERKESGAFKIHVMDIYSPRGEGLAPPFKVSGSFSFPPEAANDFPIYEHLSKRHGVIYLVSRGGYILLLDALSGTQLFRHNISKEAVFVSCEDSRSGGVLFANRKGEIISAAVNEQALIPYIQQNLRGVANAGEIALSLVRRYGYPGADETLVQLFNAAFARSDFKAAARIVASMKSGALRGPQTIAKFKAVPTQPNQTAPVLVYFSTLLEQGKLTAVESVELVRPVVAQGRREFVARWLEGDKLECTEELGDIIRPMDADLAFKVYENAGAGSKVLQCYVERGQYEKIVAYAKKHGLQTDYSVFLRSIVNVNPEGAVNFAKELLANSPPLLDINQVIEVFTQQGRLQEITSVLLDFLKGNKPEQGHLQTRLLDLSLSHSVSVAETIFQMDLFTHYDRHRVAQLCEKAGLYQRALEHYTDYADIKRILSMQSGGQINSDWLANYFGRLPPETCIECLTDMLRANRQNLQVVVQVAIKHHEAIGTQRLIDMFESFQFWDGIFYFLGAILAFSTDPNVHFKYIEAASRLNHVQEVERVCRESQYYEPVVVKDFLKQAKLLDPRPLIYVCDRHGFVAELIEYLYKNHLMKFIEAYCVKVNPAQVPTAIGVLIDLDCSEDFMKNLLQNVRGTCPVSELVESVEKRNRLRLLLPWLEARVAEGNQEPPLHNALAMIYIDTNRDPEGFLKTNAFYDPKVVGKYCEERDPHLAYTAYKKNWGRCDYELVEVTGKNGLFRLQARYLVERQSADLWARVLDPENEWRQQVVDQVLASALPESSSAEEVSATVRAFIAANLPNELMELLEKIVLRNSDFSQNKNLQNLLILTAIKSDPSRVMDYLNRLEHYDGPEIAAVALGDDYKMYEEAVLVYQKCGMDENAVDVIIDKIGSLERGQDFAIRCDKPSVWGKLGRALLAEGKVPEAVDALLKAEDAGPFKEMIAAAEAQQRYSELIKYLMMARKAMASKDSAIDGELVYSLAKCGRLAEMEEFVLGSNTANVQAVGDRLAEDGDYTAAKSLYSSIPNYAKLASCHLKLGEYLSAVEAAKKANSPKTWKEVNIECVLVGEFKYAHIAGLAIVGHPDHMEELILNYERVAHFEELIALLEAGVNSDRAPVTLFSELGAVYAKYKPAKLGQFIRTLNVSSGRLNIPKLVRACEQHLLWNEAVFLHITYKEYDQAVNTMLTHPTAWSHQEFLQIIVKIANSELYYRAMSFYLDMAPMEVNSLLIAISPKVDHGRSVQLFRKLGHLPLILPFLEHVQTQQLDIPAVNTALNELYVESEDVERLQKSVLENPSFDQLALAQQLQSHRLPEMRRIACLLYSSNRRFAEAIELAKEDGHFRDAMEAARSSDSPDVAENLLRYFATVRRDRECFAACLHVCYDLLRPDVVLELAWTTGFTDYAMPYLIQAFREVTTRLDQLEKRMGLKDVEKEKSAPNDYVPDYIAPIGTPMLPGMGQLALMAAPATGGGHHLSSSERLSSLGGAPASSSLLGGTPAFNNATFKNNGAPLESSSRVVMNLPA